MKAEDVQHMKEDRVRHLLETIIRQLDELDQEGFFGTQGWRYQLLGEA